MAKIVPLQDVPGIAAIAENNDKIEAALDNTLSRDGSGPNEMSHALDMNGQRILNLADAVSNQEPVTLAQASVIAGVTNPLTQESVAAVLWPRTAAEIGAGITPSDYRFPSGHLCRYGILPDASEQTEELQAVIDFCEVANVPISAANVGTYATNFGITINDTIVITSLTGDLSNVLILCPSSTVTPAIRVGVTTSGPTRHRGQLKLPMVDNTTKPGSGWASQGTGIEFAEVYEGSFFVPYVKNFATAILAGGYTSGFAYNMVTIGQLDNNKVGIKIGGQQTTGWANQNLWISGRISINTAEGTDISGARYVQLTPTADTSTGVDWPNSNTFIGLSLEGDRPQYHAEIAGNNNLFINCRWEATTPTVLLTGHATNTETYENQIIGGSNVCDIAFTKSGIALYNGVHSPRSAAQGGSGVCWNLKNESSSTSPLIQGFPAASTEQYLNAGTSATEWSMRLCAHQMLGKQQADTNERFSVLMTTGAIAWGGGSGATDVTLSRDAANVLKLADGDSLKLQGTWDGGTLRLGTYYLWVDATGDLRIKDGAPSSGTDGTVVGTQS